MLCAQYIRVSRGRRGPSHAAHDHHVTGCCVHNTSGCPVGGGAPAVEHTAALPLSLTDTATSDRAALHERAPEVHITHSATYNNILHDLQ